MNKPPVSAIPAIPPLAGILSYDRAARPGIGVDESVDLLRRYNWTEKKLFDLSAAFLNSTPEWEIKCALSFHIYLDAEHAKAIRTRVSELRKPPHHMDKSPDPQLDAFLNEAFLSRDSVELLTAIYKVIRPELVSAYQHHLERTNGLFDHPTVRALKINLEEEREMIAWGAAALAAMTTTPEAQAKSAAWEKHLRAYLAAARGIIGTAPAQESTVPASRSVEKTFVLSVDPQRDSRSREIYNFSYRPNDIFKDPNAGYDERNLALMFKRYHEMDVPEVMAAIIAQTPGKPWDYYTDMARQLWDEARHAMMGEVWFVANHVDYAAFPNHVGWSLQLNMDCTALERHLVLYGIEQRLMHGQTGKRYECDIAEAANDPLTVYFQDYDWADEVLHAQIGRKWLQPEIGHTSDLMAKSEEIAMRPKPIIAERSKLTPQLDWWPEFVRVVLKKESTSQAGIPKTAAAAPSYESMTSG